MKNNPIEKIRDLLAEPEARRKAAICAGLAAALAVGGAGIAIASNRPEPIDSTPSAVEKAGAESVAPADIAKICPTLTLDGQDVGAPADEGDKSETAEDGSAKADDSGAKADTKSDTKKNDSKGNAATQASGGSSSSSSASGSAQSQKKWVPEQGHWETDYGQVWVPNVVYVRHGRFICNACGAAFDSKNGFYAHSDAMYAQGQNHDGYTDDSYTTSEDQGHYEQQATGRHWVVDVAGHWE